jgi:chloramphenicol 3-O-phosphotransferase
MRLVFIHGGAAVGKLTVAKELSKLSGLPVFHNHLVVDALLAVFPFGDPAFVRLREEMWSSVFLEAAHAGRSLIFTFAPEPTVSDDFPERVAAMWEAQGGRIDFVRLTASREVQEQRLEAESRKAFGKLSDVGLLCELRSGFEASEAAMPASAVEIDTGLAAPDEAARRIVQALGL